MCISCIMSMQLIEKLYSASIWNSVKVFSWQERKSDNNRLAGLIVNYPLLVRCWLPTHTGKNIVVCGQHSMAVQSTWNRKTILYLVLLELQFMISIHSIAELKRFDVFVVIWDISKNPEDRTKNENCESNPT